MGGLVLLREVITLRLKRRHSGLLESRSHYIAKRILHAGLCVHHLGIRARCRRETSCSSLRLLERLRTGPRNAGMLAKRFDPIFQGTIDLLGHRPIIAQRPHGVQSGQRDRSRSGAVAICRTRLTCSQLRSRRPFVAAHGSMTRRDNALLNNTFGSSPALVHIG